VIIIKYIELPIHACAGKIHTKMLIYIVVVPKKTEQPIEI